MAHPSDYLTSPRSLDLRRTMVDRQLRTFDVTDADVLSAVIATPREPFVSGHVDSLVYSDANLSAQGGKTKRRLLTPMAVARALQLAHVSATDRVLDVAGSGGYSAALASRLAREVVALDDDRGFVDQAEFGFKGLGLSNARATFGDLGAGLPGEGPFDVILIGGAVEEEPEALLAQLADGGRLLAVRSASDASGQMTLWERAGGVIGSRPLFGAPADSLPAFARRPSFAF
ncbi:MAG: protein-L-isoaspartate O-methyltransferase family protein [Beijerinckiaceae bacterium]|jgi:protein-L-isoaspartate(D-aspartate) O-methyltransferase